MRSAEAGAVPGPSAYRRLGVRHHRLGPCVQPTRRARSRRGPHREYPATTADAVSGQSAPSSPAFAVTA